MSFVSAFCSNDQASQHSGCQREDAHKENDGEPAPYFYAGRQCKLRALLRGVWHLRGGTIHNENSVTLQPKVFCVRSFFQLATGFVQATLEKRFRQLASRLAITQPRKLHACQI